MTGTSTGDAQSTRAAKTGAPAHLVQQMKTLGIEVGILERIAAVGIPWALVDRLLHTPGLKSREDAHGLLNLWNFDLSHEEVEQWSRLGSMEAAWRMLTKGFDLDFAQQFPIPNGDLNALLRLTQEASKHSMMAQDLILWFRGGVLTLTPPYVNEHKLRLWRRVGSQQVGMRTAALAAAAGLSPQELLEMVQSGTFSPERVRLLAAMRGATGALL